MDILKKIREKLELGNNEDVEGLVKSALINKISPNEILKKGLIDGMNLVSEKYKNHEIFLPDVLLSAKAMHHGLDILKPLFVKERVPNLGKIVIGTVFGDLHDIGKNLVGTMLAGIGMEVIDLGNNVPSSKFIEVAKKENASLIGLSALLTTTMPAMKEVISLVKSEGINDRVKVIIGGAPVSNDYAKEIGADGYGHDSASAIECVKQLIGD